MRFSWNEIRARAAAFSEEWKDARYEKGETQSFYNEFFNVFGVQRKRVGIFEKHVKKLDNQTGFIDLFWPGVLLVEQKSAGRNLEKALEQAADYCTGLKPAEHPRYLLVSDFQNFILYDLEERTEFSFLLAELHEHIEKLWFIAGGEKREFRDQDPVNVAASEHMGQVHDALEAAKYTGHDLERFLVRLVFCLFADDTDIFDRGIFQSYLENRTHEDGSDFGGKIIQLFETLNTPIPDRYTILEEDLTAFPYVNGDLFKSGLRTPSLNSAMRKTIIEACQFDWGKISPAIFGSLFQSVMDSEVRRQQGAHYTTEKNILKVIGPLFMDELWEDFGRIKNIKTKRKKALQDFQKKLSELTFFDPACGCGNFLVISYRELRRLEIEVLREIYPKGQRELDISILCKIDVDQFYGIEIDEFPCRIAETALWMMDHIMNNELSRAFGQSFLRIPLKKSPHIVHGNALQLDWQTVLPAKRCSYVFGNPPFSGAMFMQEDQRNDMKLVFEGSMKGYGVLDYVSCWYLKSAKYINKTNARVGLVSTNSIAQGEQVNILWPTMFDRYGVKINFAHRTFAWSSEARGRAAVFCVIIGFSMHDSKNKFIYEYKNPKSEAIKINAKNINSYLADAPNVFIINRKKPICNVPPMRFGSMPRDGGNFLMSKEERNDLIQIEPKAKKFIKQFIGAKEFLQGQERWVLWLLDAKPSELKNLPNVMEKVKMVREFRESSKAATTRKFADQPTVFCQIAQPKTSYLLVPRVSSEKRRYIPMSFFSEDHIVSDSCLAIPGLQLHHFGVLTSLMHMAWVGYTAGRLKSDYRYSKDIVYNNFPWPQMTAQQETAISKLTQSVLDARTAHPAETLATLYHSDYMPADLYKAHTALDRAVDRLYRKAPFNSERERVEHLFALYEKMTQPLVTKLKKRKKGESV